MRNLLSAIFLVLVTILNGLSLERAAAEGTNFAAELPRVAAQAEITAVADECLPSPDRCTVELSAESLASLHCLGECPAWLTHVEPAAPFRAAALMLLPDLLLRVGSTASPLRPPIAA